MRLTGTLVLVGALAAGAPSPQAPPPAAAPAAAVSADDLMATVRTLAAPDMEGRRAGSPGGLKARAFIEGRFKAIGLEPVGDSFLHPFTAGEAAAANIIGRCPGRAPDLPVMVVSAHYDHLGQRDGATFHGADDNASGVAGLLAIAADCQRVPFRRTALFVAFDAEEMRLAGARHFVRTPPVPIERLGLNVNLDMVARGDKGELYIAGTHHHPALAPLLAPVAAQAPIRVLFGHDRPEDGVNDWTMQSDHGPFHQAKIPFVYFGVEDHPDYHKPTDTADKINPTFFRNAVEVILAAVRALDAGLPSPR
ncbi:MAG: M28 family peptidase [Acidobacteriota bacterium]